LPEKEDESNIAGRRFAVQVQAMMDSHCLFAIKVKEDVIYWKKEN
jgi:hypothetical protein